MLILKLLTKELLSMPIITEKAKNQKQVLTLNELEKRKVVENNALITSVAKMQKTALKMFELAVSCIDTENVPENNTVYLSKEELFSFFEVGSNSKHTQFKEAIEIMQKQAYFKIKSNKKLGIEYESIVPIPYVKWNDYNDEVTIQFMWGQLRGSTSRGQDSIVPTTGLNKVANESAVSRITCL